MNPYGFWSTPTGRQIARGERLTRMRWVRSSGEPWLKKDDRSGERERELRRVVNEELVRLRHGTLLGPVAVSLWFTTNANPAPPVEELTKAVLDSLRQRRDRPQVDEGRPSMLDDVQVRCLQAYCSTACGGKQPPSTWIQIRPLRDVAADLRELHTVAMNSHEVERHVDEQLLSRPEYPDLDDDEIVTLPDDLRAWSVALHQRNLQEYLLADLDAALLNQLLTQPYRIFGVNSRSAERRMQELMGDGLDGRPLGDEVWDFVVDQLAFKLPAPTGRGRSTKQHFLPELEESMAALRTRCPHLSPLLTPARVTLLVVPPRSQPDRDWDNLARQVLPTVRRHLLDPDAPRAVAWGSPAAELQEFQVFQVQRRNTDPEHGMLRLVPGPRRFTSDWERVRGLLDDVEGR